MQYERAALPAGSLYSLLQMTRSMLPFLVQSKLQSPRLFELCDGRFQLLDALPISPFLAGVEYLLVEYRLAQFFAKHRVAAIEYVDAVLYDRASSNEFRTHARLLVSQRCDLEQIDKLDFSGLRLTSVGDEYYFVSRELKELLQVSGFDYLEFSQGFGGFAASV